MSKKLIFEESVKIFINKELAPEREEEIFNRAGELLEEAREQLQDEYPELEVVLMAMMDHDCRTCGHSWGDNNAKASCPKCGSTDVASFSDEPDDYDDEEGYIDEPDEDEEDEDD